MAVGDRERRRLQPAAFEIAQDGRPTLARFPHAALRREHHLLAVGERADHDQQRRFRVLQARLHVEWPCALGVLVPWPWVLLIFGALLLVGAAGAMLLRRREAGEVLTYVAQALQVPYVAVGPVAFRFVAGLQASVLVTAGRLSYFIGVATSITLWRPDNGAPTAIGLNFVPIMILI